MPDAIRDALQQQLDLVIDAGPCAARADDGRRSGGRAARDRARCGGGDPARLGLASGADAG